MKSLALIPAIILSILFTTQSFALDWTQFNTGNSEIPSNSITAILSDTDDETWVGTDNGLAYFDGSDWTIYNSSNSGLPDDFVRDLHRAENGDVWVATDNGAMRIGNSNWEVFNTFNSDIPSDYIRSITSDEYGQIWIGTWGGGIAMKNKNGWTVYNTSNSALPSNGVFTIDIDPSGRIWSGTFNAGVAVLNDGNWSVYNTSNSPLPHNHVRSITFDHNNVWLGTEDGLARRTSFGDWTVYNYSNIGYTFHTVYEGINAESGTLHFATDGGILRFDHSNFHVTTAQNSDLSSNNVRSLYEDTQGNLWAGTGNNGISVFGDLGAVSVKEPIKGADLITIYPNPSTGEITFLLPNKHTGINEVWIIDGTGKEVLREKFVLDGIQQRTLDLSQLTSGTYHLILSGSNTVMTKPFSKI